MFLYRGAGAIVACLAVLGSSSAYGASVKTGIRAHVAAAACTPQIGGTSEVSGLPLPKACATAQPTGAAGDLKVLPWAGFKGAISYTFDDASPSQIRYYDVLKAAGLHLTFYVVPSQVQRTDPDGNSLVDAWKHVAADGNELGNHTVNHCNVSADGTALTNCAFGTPDADHGTAATQIAAVNDYIVNTLGQPAVWTMASPYGDANYDGFAASAGFIAQRDVWIHKSASFLPPGDVANVYHLPCYAGGGLSGGWGIDTNQSTFEKVINDARGRGRWGIFLFHGIGPDQDPVWAADKCCPVDATAIAGSMEHLKAWGDVWGDSIVDISAYTIGQSLFASLTLAVTPAGTVWTWELPASFPPGKYLRVTTSGGTLKQTIGGIEQTLPWNPRGFYEVSLSAGNLTLAP